MIANSAHRSIPLEETRIFSVRTLHISSLVGPVGLASTLPVGCRRREPRILSWFLEVVLRLKQPSKLFRILSARVSMCKSVAAMWRISEAWSKTLFRSSLACLPLVVLYSVLWFSG